MWLELRRGRAGRCKDSPDSPTPHHKFDSNLAVQIPSGPTRGFTFATTPETAHHGPVNDDATMADSLDYVKICESCPPGDGWGPSVTTDTTLNGVPYAPFSKGDKLGRMADWTAEGKDRERGGRMQYNRNYRGTVDRCPCTRDEAGAN